MKIFIKSYNSKLEILNNNKNQILIKNTLISLIIVSFIKGGIIYREKKSFFFDILQKLFKIPYLYGEIDNITDFENHYAKIKKYEIPVLMYHQFVKNKNEGGKIKLFVTKKQFEIHLKILKFLGYETITFEELEKLGLQNRFNKKYIILTVDDGYKDNYEILFPLLKKYKMKAVIFLVSGLDHNEWTMKSNGEKRFDLLTDEQIKEMLESRLIEFGGHTLTHISFKEVNDEKAKYEIVEDKKITEKRLGKKIITFAYPYGHRKEETKKLIKENGYIFGVSTDTGSGIFTEDLYDIRRIAIDKTSLFDFFRKISPRYAQYKAKKYGNK